MKGCCCAQSVPHHGSLEALAQAVGPWQARLQAGLSRSIQASDQTLGHLEEEILHTTRELERSVLEEAAQKKADQTPPVCPVCGESAHQRSPALLSNPLWRDNDPAGSG